jgi:hypothetical protein
MPQQNLEALDHAIARADLTVACLKSALRLRAVLGRFPDRADQLVQEAERRAEHLRHARMLLTVSRDRRVAA